MTQGPRFPFQLHQDLTTKYGIDWKKDRKKAGKLTERLDLACVERICANLRLLLPLKTAFWMEGINTQSQEMFFNKLKANISIWKWVNEQFEQAKAEGEALVLAKLHDPNTSKKECDRLQWLLERALEDSHYTPKTKSVKTINENKTVNVQMKVSGGVNKALPAASQGVLEAEIVKALPPTGTLKEN